MPTSGSLALKKPPPHPHPPPPSSRTAPRPPCSSSPRPRRRSLPQSPPPPRRRRQRKPNPAPGTRSCLSSAWPSSSRPRCTTPASSRCRSRSSRTPSPGSRGSCAGSRSCSSRSSSSSPMAASFFACAHALRQLPPPPLPLPLRSCSTTAPRSTPLRRRWRSSMRRRRRRRNPRMWRRRTRSSSTLEIGLVCLSESVLIRTSVCSDSYHLLSSDISCILPVVSRLLPLFCLPLTVNEVTLYCRRQQGCAWDSTPQDPIMIKVPRIQCTSRWSDFRREHDPLASQ
ncbi:hypothetical protein DFH09DRAFT_203289 [Mycena vulgaris]|nr:hypothetical protein DFH09DRAFT_203289 [Mycena vulgaris]